MVTKGAISLLLRSHRFGKQLNRNVANMRRPELRCTIAVPHVQCFSTEKASDAAQQQQQIDPQVNTEDFTITISKLTDEIETLNKEVQSLKAKNEDLLDKYKRSLADSENMRVRLSKQIADAKIYGIQNFCKDLLEVADTLSCATDAVPKDKVNENPHLKNLYEGLNMTMASLLHVFKRHGLEQVNPLQQKFDPNFHEALFQKPDGSVEPDTVVEVSKLGYTLHGRVIRPAMVGVSKTP